VPYTKEALEVICRNIDAVQEGMGRELLIENPSSYVTFREADMAEWEFLNRIAQRTGCGILLDLNNIYVTAHNHKLDADKYLEAIAISHVKEMHLAGYSEREIEGNTLLVDTHSAPVFEGVWALYEKAVQRFGAIPTLIEWDSDLPAFSVLEAEAAKAREVQKAALGRAG
jgi:hypothetical protein